MTTTTERVRDWPRTVDDAVKRIVAMLDNESKRGIREVPEDKLGRLHFPFGMHVRNRFGLWNGNADLISSGGETHPEAVSRVIIRKL